MHRLSPPERLGAHVSVQGGVEKAPVRGKVIGATAIQVFTKTPSQWREPGVSMASFTEFQRECERCELSSIVGHDSYLINLASPDPALSTRSEAAFVAELRRCEAFGISFLVSHPGNYIDDRSAGLVRNAAAYTRCLRTVSGSVVVLLETTAGCGTALGSTFEELAVLRAMIGDDVRHRVAFCADTCHLYSAGYDLVGDYDAVWRHWDTLLGLGHASLPPSQRLQDTICIASRPPRADRRGIARTGAIPPNHDRLPAGPRNQDSRNPQRG